MHTCQQPGCREFNELSRRQFLGYSGWTAAVLATAPTWMPRTVFARGGTGSRDVLISLFLRGGADGLTLCVPYFDPDYYAARPTLAIPRPDSGSPFAAVDLDGSFGLPPAMASLLPAYQAADLVVIHACGSPDGSRSHFDAMQNMETGQPGSSALFTGWLGRHLLNTAPARPDALLRAVGLDYGLQRTLAGAPLTLPIPDLQEFGMGGWAESVSARSAAYQQSYARPTYPVLHAAAEGTLETIRLLEQIDFENYQPAGGAVYPESDLGHGLKSLAALIKAETGLEAAAIDAGGWDTHEGQEPQQGWMAYLMNDLSHALAAFHADVVTKVPRVCVVVMSEFGRNVAENQSGGTDHGHGNLMLAMGSGILGGRVLRNWPGLAPEQLFQHQDLQVTIDYRDVLAEILVHRLHTPDISSIFPGYSPKFPGVTRP